MLDVSSAPFTVQNFESVTVKQSLDIELGPTHSLVAECVGKCRLSLSAAARANSTAFVSVHCTPVCAF